jgi:glutamate synthase domain-containing protein 2
MPSTRAAEDHVEDGDLGDLQSYRGGLNFEAVGLSRAMVAEYFPGMQSAFRASA